MTCEIFINNPWPLAVRSALFLLLSPPSLNLQDALDLVATSDRFHWQVPLFVLLAIAVGVSGLAFLSHCMKRFDATYSASMFVVSYIISATVMSMVRYHMIDRLKAQGPVQMTLYPLGLAILFGGVYFLMVDKQVRMRKKRR